MMSATHDTRTVLAMRLTYRTSVAVVDSNPRKCDQRRSAAFDRVLITIKNEYHVYV